MNEPGVAVVLADPRTHRVLLLHRALHWAGWEYVKGHRERGETDEATALRETLEETGRSPEALFHLNLNLLFRADDGARTYQCLLGTMGEGAVTVGPEHDGFRWVTVAEARDLLTFPDLLPPLEAAQTFISHFL